MIASTVYSKEHQSLFCFTARIFFRLKASHIFLHAQCYHYHETGFVSSEERTENTYKTGW